MAQRMTVSANIPIKGTSELELVPDIKQTIAQDNSNLSYLWQRRDGLTGWKTIGTEHTCKLILTTEDKNNFIVRLTVTDTRQNIKSYLEYTVKMITPFTRCWFILEEVGGQPVLSSLDGEYGERVISSNIYQRLTGQPLMLVVHNSHRPVSGSFPQTSRTETVINVFTNNNGWMLDGNSLAIRKTYGQLLLKKQIDNTTNYAPTYASADQGENIIDNGEFWYAMPTGLSIYYPVTTSDDSPYRATMSMAVNEYAQIVFDAQNNRFLYYKNSNIALDWYNQLKIYGENYAAYSTALTGKINKAKLTTIGENAGNPNKFNPNDVGDGKTMRYMGPTTDASSSRSVAIATDVVSAIESWNRVFEAVGIRTPLRVIRAPQGHVCDDPRYSYISYKVSPIENAYGPALNDPRTGEILSAHIAIFSSVMNQVQKWYFAQCGAVDQAACQVELPDSLLGRIFEGILIHEMGHSLGLTHNFIGSALNTPAQLRSRSYLNNHTTGASVMDYQRFNHAAQPEDSLCGGALLPQIGDYDYFAIACGYGEFASEEQRRRRIDSLSQFRALRFAENNFDNPESLAEDLSDDNLTCIQLGISNLERLMPTLCRYDCSIAQQRAVTASRYMAVWDQLKEYAIQCTAEIGARPINGRVAPAERQREALQLLSHEILSNFPLRPTTR